MIEEGFNEENILESIGNGVVLENYPDDCRCFIFGGFHFTENTTSSLHAVCDYVRTDLVDIVTAYIPQKHGGLAQLKGGRYHEKAKRLNGATLFRVWRND